MHLMAWRITGSSCVRSIIALRSAAGFFERTGQKIVFQSKLANLRMQLFHINRRRCFRRSASFEHDGDVLQQLIFPLLNLVRLSAMLCIACR